MTAALLKPLTFGEVLDDNDGRDEYYRASEVDALLARKDAALASMRRWVQLWRTNEIDSISAIRQVGIDFDVLEKNND